MMNQRQFLRGMFSVALAAVLCIGTIFTGNTIRVAASEPVNAVTGLTAMQVVGNMGYGINIGNSLDATKADNDWNNRTGNAILNQETSWGNPALTADLFEGIYSAGFSCVRIPITWQNYVSDDGNYTIDAAWMAHIKEVVDWALDAGLYVIINTHHDAVTEESDLKKTYETAAAFTEKLWAQIATKFADYDQRLIFEGVNEPTTIDSEGNRDWYGDDELYEIINYLNQVFTTTIRANGQGYNDERVLMIQAYAASSSSSLLETISLPTYNDEVVNNLAISTHCYLPYGFGISGEIVDFDATSEDSVGGIEDMFETADRLFISKGIPLIVGETSAVYNNNNDERAEWAYYMGLMAAKYAASMILWDNGASTSYPGNECHPWIDRYTYQIVSPDVVEQLFVGASNTTWGSSVGTYAVDATSDYLTDTLASQGLQNKVIWSNNEGTTIDWSNYVDITPEADFFYTGRSLAIVYSGSSAPKLAMSSASYAETYGTDTYSYWWMDDIDASSTDTVGSLKVAYYTAEDIAAYLKTQGGCTTSALSAIKLTGNTSTVYEVVSAGPAMITYKVLGLVYASQASMPSNPASSYGLAFDGWYLENDYDADSKFTAVSQANSYNTIVYAKMVEATEVKLGVGKTKSVAKTGATYSSSKTSVATISSAGKITAKKVGTALITVKVGSKNFYYQVKVTPAATTSVTATNYATGIHLAWKKVANAAGYYIYRSTDGSNYTKIKKITSGSTVSYTDTKATTNGKRYYYMVRAYASTGIGLKSSVLSTYYLSRATLSKAENTNSYVKITWKKNSKATGYIIYRSINGGSFSKIKTISKNTTLTYTDKKATKNGAKYTYRVVAYKKVSTTVYKAKVSANKVIYRLNRSAFSSLKSTTAGKVSAVWSKNTKATGYQVKYVYGSTEKTVKIKGYKVLKKTFSGLKQGKKYAFYIRTYKTVSGTNYYSAWSAKKKITVKKA